MGAAMLADRAVAVLVYWNEVCPGHSGPGWYYYDDEYPDEGSCGAFATREEAVAHAEAAEYRVEGREGNSDE